MKFCATNTLQNEDKIMSTFYDAGKLHKLEPLSQLKSLPLNSNRETILVDFQNDEKLIAIIEGSIKDYYSIYFRCKETRWAKL